jgi:Mg2+ and Co2+ transporter CorA
MPPPNDSIYGYAFIGAVMIAALVLVVAVLRDLYITDDWLDEENHE